MTKSTQAQIEAADKLAVQIVTLVVDATDNDGTMGAYEGIETAREVRGLIVAALTAAAGMEITEQQIDAAIAAYHQKREGDTEDDRMKAALTAAAAAIRALED